MSFNTKSLVDWSGEPTESHYPLPTESVVELVRIQRQGALMTGELGGLLPPLPFLPNGICRILDLCCGSGDWVCAVAQKYTDKAEVIGCDISPHMVRYSHTRGISQGLQNCSFDEVDVNEHPLPYQDQSFHVVNLRFGVGCIPREKWAPLIQDIYRLLLPGGYAIFTEADTPASTSSSLNTLNECIATTLWKKGLSFSETGETIRIIDPLLKLIRASGLYSLVEEHPKLISITPYSDNYSDWMQDFTVLFHEIKGLMIQMEIITDAFFTRHFGNFQLEYRRDEFQAFIPINTIVAQR